MGGKLRIEAFSSLQLAFLYIISGLFLPHHLHRNSWQQPGPHSGKGVILGAVKFLLVRC